MRGFLILTILAVPMASLAAPEPDSEEQLLLDLQAVQNDPGARPSHVAEELPNSFGELVEAHLGPLNDSYQRVRGESAEDMEVRQAVFAGTRPLSDLAPVWRAELERMRPDVEAVLIATHARDGRLPKELQLAGVLPDAKDLGQWIALQHAANLAGLSMLLDLEAHSADHALATCADTLALGRDVARSFLVGQMVGAAITGIAWGPCQRAMREANPGALEQFARSAQIIQKGWPSVAHTLEQEKVFAELVGFDELSSATQAKIPPELQYHAPPVGFWKGARMKLFGGWARRKRVIAMDRLIAAEALPPVQADAVFDTWADDLDTAETLAAVTDDGHDTNWTPYVQRIRVSSARVELLGLASRVRAFEQRNHRWPSSWAELGAPAPLDPRSQLPITLEVTDVGAALAPRGDWPRTKDDLRIDL